MARFLLFFWFNGRDYVIDKQKHPSSFHLQYPLEKLTTKCYKTKKDLHFTVSLLVFCGPNRA